MLRRATDTPRRLYAYAGALKTAFTLSLNAREVSPTDTHTAPLRPKGNNQATRDT